MANYKFGTYEPPHKRWPVAWYNPIVLLRSNKEMTATGDQIRNLDRREFFTEEFKAINITPEHPSGDFWWDFMSDTGDGGNASYTIARAMQTHALQLEDGAQTTLPRGELLVLGGDLAYPGGGMEEYQYRFIEIWEAAQSLEQKSPEQKSLEQKPPTVVAIPQNHDWFDNIATFNRHFIGDFKNHFIQAKTPQTRSYFAARLPHNWWILGMDWALVGDLDRGQLDAFLALIASDIQANHNVILLYPEPYWTRPLGDNASLGYPKRYQRLEAALLEKNIRIRLRIAGDLHHYCRATATTGADLPYDDMLITCGSGGAFLHPTHAKRVTQTKILDREQDNGAIASDLKKRVRVGLQNEKASTAQREYISNNYYPSLEESEGLCWRNLYALFKTAPTKDLYSAPAPDNFLGKIAQRTGETLHCIFSGNVALPLMFGLLYFLAILCNSSVFSGAFSDNGITAASKIGTLALLPFLAMWFKAFFFSPLALIVHAFVFLLSFSVAIEDGKKSILSGLFLSALQITAIPIVFWSTAKLFNLHFFSEHHIGEHTLVYYADYFKGFLVAIGGTVIGGLLFGIYFTIMSYLGLLANNAFSTLAHQGYKGFLRFRIDAEGNLHGYMIGTDKVPQAWKLNPESTHPLWVEQNETDAPAWKIRDTFVLNK